MVTFFFLFLISAIHHAVVKNNLDVVKLLLSQNKIDLKIKSYEGQSALFVGIGTASYEVLEELLKKEPTLVLMNTNEDVSPLHEAVKSQRLNIVKLLLEYGANISHVDLDAENVLHIACSVINFELIEYLINETEVDPTAKNLDGMNPLCVMLIRSGNENQDLVLRTFFLLLERTYEKDLITNNYTIKDIFQPTFLSCVYSQYEVINYLIHNIYSQNNSKYKLIEKLDNMCRDNVIENDFLYYIFVFLHDDIKHYNQFSFPRFSEIHQMMYLRATIQIMIKATDPQLVITLLENLQEIGFKLRTKEFEDQLGYTFLSTFSEGPIDDNNLQRVLTIVQYLNKKGFNLNLCLRSYLQSTSITPENRLNQLSISTVTNLLLRYSWNFITNDKHWRQISFFYTLNQVTRLVIEQIVINFGCPKNFSFVPDIPAIVFPLKHLCRNVIRENLKTKKHDYNFNLPKCLENYIAFN